MLVLAALSPAALDWLAVLWFLALGGVIGSFLNVVVYRVPRGMSLIEPGSHCPACKHPVRWHDNVPVVSWFVLRARCRDCDVPISVRYPIIEAITAALFAAIAGRALFSGGQSLPIRPIEVVDGTIGLVPTGWELAGICAYHLLLLCTLLAIALIEYDGCRVPVRLAVPALLVGLAAPLAWPLLHPVPVWSGLDGWVAGLADGVCGLVLGGVLSLPWWPKVRFFDPCMANDRGRSPVPRLGALDPRIDYTKINRRQPSKLLALACIGLFLGYQAVGPVLAAALVIHLPTMLFGRFRPALRRVPLTAWLAIAAFVWILAWQQLVASWPVFW